MSAPRDFDAIVVGSGPGGAAAADVLTAAGWSVCVFERGRNHLIDLDDPTRLLDHYSNDELKFTVRHFLGPDPLVEPRTFRRSAAAGEREHVGEVNDLPATVGGGGVHADGKVPRFREVDFRMREAFGPVDGAEVEDWPVDYEELEPWYAAAERAVGVAGDAGANPFASWRSGPYPMPPGAPMYGATISAAAAERLGLHPYPAPTAANSVPYDGRPACNDCGFCASYGCPIHAKGDPVAMLQRALLTGRCVLRPDSFVRRVLTRDGRATGVEWETYGGEVHVETAPWVVLACGAHETPRLLLLSGLGGPAVGRHLMFHFQTYVMGSLPQRLHPHRGRAVTHVHDDHLVPDEASRRAARVAGLPWMRGGMVEHAGPAHPVQEAKLYPRGPAHVAAMRDSAMRERMWGFCMQGEDLPQAANTIDLDPSVRDARGVPVARVTHSPHLHERVASAHYGAVLESVLREAGAEWSVVTTSPDTGAPFGGFLSPVPVSRHVMGTARMGADPRRSVVDRWQRLHDAPNVVVADSSVFVTSSGYGPTLTLVALSMRAAYAMASEGSSSR